MKTPLSSHGLTYCISLLGSLDRVGDPNKNSQRPEVDQLFTLSHALDEIMQASKTRIFGRLVESIPSIKLVSVRAFSVASVCIRLPEGRWPLVIVADDGQDPLDKCGFKLPDMMWTIDPQSQLTLLRPETGFLEKLLKLDDHTCDCAKHQTSSEISAFMNGCDDGVNGKVENGKVKVTILGYTISFDAPGIAEGTAVRVNLHRCGANCTKGARAELFVNGQLIACYTLFGDCDC